MHQFYFNGIYSDWYNRYTLAYLLVMESILETGYKWKRIYQHTHYCHIECYHVYLWRYKWEHNIWLSIFMDSKMNRLMTHKHVPLSRTYFVNGHFFVTNYMIRFEFIVFRKF